jgi:hypothetical protein
MKNFIPIREKHFKFFNQRDNPCLNLQFFFFKKINAISSKHIFLFRFSVFRRHGTLDAGSGLHCFRTTMEKPSVAKDQGCQIFQGA